MNYVIEVITVNFPDHETDLKPRELVFNDASLIPQRLEDHYPGYTSAVLTIVPKRV